MIGELIDKQDNFEVIRDQIAGILVTESAAQQALATAGGKDPDLWKLRVYTERSNPWEVFMNAPTDVSPIVNVWYDNSNFDESKSNVFERQLAESVFNIDCYGYGQSADAVTGHVAGDQQAALEAQRALRLVRNILMSGCYQHLDLQGLVWQRWPQSTTAFQAEQNAQAAVKVVANRLALRVRFNEFSPQCAEETLEYVAIDVKRAEDGQIVLEADYQYPL